jgi:Leucine-rich repeat (LRR) protein
MKLRTSVNRQKCLVLATTIHLSLGVCGVSVPLQAETNCNRTNIPRTECEALIDFYKKSNGPGWVDNTNWNETDEPCGHWDEETKSLQGGWHGIDCKRKDVNNSSENPRLCAQSGCNHINSLILYNNGLSGKISDLLGDLRQLEGLFLHNNHFTGPIPDSLKNLTQLRYLSLNGNPLEKGPIPEWLQYFTNLETLYFKLHKFVKSVKT